MTPEEREAQWQAKWQGTVDTYSSLLHEEQDAHEKTKEELASAEEIQRKALAVLGFCLERYDARDTGEGFPNGSLAWAMRGDVARAIKLLETGVLGKDSASAIRRN